MRARRISVAVSILPLLAALAALAALAGLTAVPAVSMAAEAETAEESETAACAADGTALEITAFDNAFDKDCLAAPPEQAFTIEFRNDDRGIPHNVSIYDTSGDSEETLFEGELIDGGTVVYDVPALAAGTYEFRCDPHAEFMKGTFIVA